MDSTIASILEEYNLTIDDIRWYIAVQMGEKMLSYRDNPEELYRWIWSKRLEDQLYNMEENFLLDLEEGLTAERYDTSVVRQKCAEIAAVAAKR